MVPLPEDDEVTENKSKGGKWAQLNAVEQEKYIKMHTGACRVWLVAYDVKL